LGTERNNVLDGQYNEKNKVWKSKSQDRRFIEDMKIGDIVIVPFKGIKQCIMARIISNPLYVIDTGLFITTEKNKIHISDKGDIYFRPIGRQIEVIGENIEFNDKRVLPRVTLSSINPSILSKNICTTNDTREE
tara:strand:- start:1279 stop:1680 length:402 start_codon:yes stop_codon:yes gene_type:complete